LVACVVAAAGAVTAVGVLVVPTGRFAGAARAVVLTGAVVVAGALGGLVADLTGALGLVRAVVLAGLAGALAVCVVLAAGYTLNTAGRPAVSTRGRRRRARRPRVAPEQQAFCAVLPLAVACPAAYLLGRLVVS
ncbi:MAG: hypothetical protein ACRDYU_08245, partial [Actinomycetes bacterium]